MQISFFMHHWVQKTCQTVIILLQVDTVIYISIQTERNTYEGTSHEIVELLQKHNVI